MTQSHSPDIDKWLSLIRADGVGPVNFRKLVAKLGSIDAVLGASVSQLTQVEGIGDKTAERIARSRGRFEAAAELALAEKHGVVLIHLDDARYPAPLGQIYDPPPVLYVKGTLTRQDNLALAVVGSRRCSHYGLEQANRFAYFLANRFTVASGLFVASTQPPTAARVRQRPHTGRQGCGLAHLPARKQDSLCPNRQKAILNEL